MVKPLLGMCRVDPGDAFTYLSWSHIMSRSNFLIREKNFQISFFMHVSLRETLKRSLKSYILKPKTFFSSNSKNFSIIKNHIDLKSGDVVWPSWTGFHFELWCLDAFSLKSLKFANQSGSRLPTLRSASLNSYAKALTRISMICIFSRFSLSGFQIEICIMKSCSPNPI